MDSELSLLGKHFIVGISGDKLSVKEGRLLGQLKPAGVILFRENLPEKLTPESVNQLRTLLRNVQDASERENFITTIDHEGGRIVRFRDGITRFPEPMCWRDLTYEVAKALARELKFLGFNVDLAPVADVLTEPECSVIGDRAFSSDPEEVKKFSNDFLRGFEEEGLLGCLKHFPGHGHVKEDSHLTLPVSRKSVSELRDCDLIPYENTNAPLIMTAHVMFQKIDADYPASLSKKIIQGLLRDDIGFNGCVCTDAIEMKALDKVRAESSVLAMDAGSDFLLFGQSSGEPPAALGLADAEKLARKIDKSAAFEQRINLSSKRIDKIFERLSFSPLQMQGGVTSLDVLRSGEHLELEEEVINARR